MTVLIKAVIVKNILLSVVFILPLLFMETQLDFSTVIQEKVHPDPHESIYMCYAVTLLAHRTGKLTFTESRGPGEGLYISFSHFIL